MNQRSSVQPSPLLMQRARSVGGNVQLVVGTLWAVATALSIVADALGRPMWCLPSVGLPWIVLSITFLCLILVSGLKKTTRTLGISLGLAAAFSFLLPVLGVPRLWCAWKCNQGDGVSCVSYAQYLPDEGRKLALMKGCESDCLASCKMLIDESSDFSVDPSIPCSIVESKCNWDSINCLDIESTCCGLRWLPGCLKLLRLDPDSELPCGIAADVCFRSDRPESCDVLLPQCGYWEQLL